GGHVLNIGHYGPYDLHGSPDSWNELREEILGRELQRIQEYIPNLNDALVGKALFTPVDIEAHNPMFYRGDIMGWVTSYPRRAICGRIQPSLITAPP
ncbi:MAG TPA: hypothetical protein VNL15_08750, partial [Dehalococcoidia bacterium]|nr:hypothetical protein [Dehalococcoidia bacterium]